MRHTYTPTLTARQAMRRADDTLRVALPYVCFAIAIGSAVLDYTLLPHGFIRFVVAVIYALA